MSKDNNASPSVANQTQEVPILNILLQFVEDMEVKNTSPWRILGAKENTLQPAFNIDVKAEKRTETEYGATILFSVLIPNPEKKGENLYQLTVRYVVIFEIRNATEEILPLLLFVQGPSLLFPYLRELVSHITQHSGLPPINLNPVNFFELFQQKFMKDQEKKDN